MFLDSWRMSRRLPDEGFSLGYEPKYLKWYWRYCGLIGLFLLAFGFAIQLYIEISSRL